MVMTDMTERELPSFRSHKIVNAARIHAAEFEADGRAKLATDFGTIQTKPGYRKRVPAFDELVGDLGVYVRYQPDGFESWSPTKAFEEGYTLLSEKIDA
jgi:hypothetical protein